MSNEKNSGCLGYLKDEILPSHIGIIINHYKDPYQPVYIMESKRLFFVAHVLLKCHVHLHPGNFLQFFVCECVSLTFLIAKSFLK